MMLLDFNINCSSPKSGLKACFQSRDLISRPDTQIMKSAYFPWL